jgi:hypothetical protein
MKYADINKRFSEIVAEHLTSGYIINTASMYGFQGETGKIDLTDGKDIIRIMVIDFCNVLQTDYKLRVATGTEIVVGKCTDDVKPHCPKYKKTIWNNHLEVLRREQFYLLTDGVYGTKSDFLNQQ